MSADHPFTNASRGIRLQKAMAEAGVASRRDCEALVATGRVHVNGHRVQTLPAWVDPDRDRIEVDGDVVAGKVQGRKKRSSSRTGGGGKKGVSAPIMQIGVWKFSNHEKMCSYHSK